MEAAVSCNDNFISKSTLSIDAMENKPTFKDVGQKPCLFFGVDH